MTQGARLTTAVMFVRDLDRSVKFYTELLQLSVADRSTTAALLVSQAGSHLVLRSMGAGAVHSLGGAGVQYVAWTAAGEEDLARSEQLLKAHSVHYETRNTEGVKVVEGRDPDDIPVLICYPGTDQIPPEQQHLWSRIYAW